MPHKHKTAPTEQKAKYKSPRKYVRVKDRRQGLEPKQRTQSPTEKKGNQWTITPKQMKFVELYFTPTSPTYANAYKSAIQAGFAHNYAIKIVSDSQGLEWIADARRTLIKYTPDHIWNKYQNVLETAQKDADKLHALDSMAKISGMFVDRSIVQQEVTFTNAVPRPTTVIEGDVVDSSPNS